MKEQNIDFEIKPVVCDGIEECRIALLKLSKGMLDANFIEGMACVGGCINGAGCLTHGEKNKAEVDKYGREALEKTITEQLRSMLGISAKVHLVNPKSIVRSEGKAKRIIDNRAGKI
jgi:iron only hydrogenase large subunit-like protein